MAKKAAALSALDLQKVAPQIFGWCKSCKTRVGFEKYRKLFDGACQECWESQRREQSLKREKEEVVKVNQQPILTEVTDLPLPTKCRDGLALGINVLHDALECAPESNRKAFLIRRAISLLRLARQ